MKLLHWCLSSITRGTYNVGLSRYAIPMFNVQSFRFRCRDEVPLHQFHTVSYNGINNGVPSQLRSLQAVNTTVTIPTRERSMIPRKAALALTPKARDLFKKMISATNSEGIILKYEISSQHALRMAFKFDLIKDTKKGLSDQDEGVSLELLEDGITPKPPSESLDDNLPKLYIHHNAFMKVLGGTLDVDFNPETGDMTPKLFDREGNEMDPNA